MAISTYTELKTAIASWLHRTDLTSSLQDFITLAESRINKTLRGTQQELETTLTATPGTRTIALPTGFKEAMALWLTYYGDRQELPFINPDQVLVPQSQGLPTRWTIDGVNLAFDIVPDAAYTFALRYLKNAALSDTNPTNWLLTAYPDVYLYGALIEGAAFIRDTEQLAIWKQAFDTALQEAVNAEMRNKKLATLTTELSGHNHSTIYEG
jgi:hypothetical protein